MTRDKTPWVERGLEQLRATNRLRTTRTLAPSGSVAVRHGNQELLLFSSNDYLGLSSHPAVREAAAEAALQYGMGPRGATLVCGHTEIHAALSLLCQAQAHRIGAFFPSGGANIGALSALSTPETRIFSDALNHASIIDGCRLARGRLVFTRGPRGSGTSAARVEEHPDDRGD